jgi:hypothetical protein
MIDAHAPTFDVTNSHVVAVDADPATVLAGLDRLDLTTPAAATLRLLGAERRVALVPTLLEPPGGRERVYGLAWRMAEGEAARVSGTELGAFAAPGYVKAIWHVRVTSDGESGAYVSTTVRFVATDENARHALRAAWRLLGPMSADLARRALASLKRIAERAGEPIAYDSRSTGFPLPQRVYARAA